MADDVGEVRKFPPWREALRQFLEAKFSPGDVIPHSWFWEAFGLTMPAPDTPVSEADTLRRKHLKQFRALYRALLRDHRVCLLNEFAFGYRITIPSEQTKTCYDIGIKAARKALRNMLDRLINVDHAALTADQRRENADALGRISMIRQMVHRQRRLPRLE